jgi:peptidoglycan/xylan/chitin deacetylase (PgdA/CDA1 family)
VTRVRLGRRILVLLLRLSLVPALARELLQRRRGTILVWHDPDPATFERHVQALCRLYSPVPLRALLQAMEEGRMDDLPPKPIVFTLDDGHAGNVHLLPVIERYQLPVTIFLCSEIVATGRAFPFSLGRPAASDGEPSPAPLHLPLSEEDIGSMRHVVDFQSHTASHARLPFCSDEDARREIAGSKRDLEQRYGLQVFALAYPNGDYCDRDIRLVEEAGYLCALTADPGLNGPRTDRYRLRRVTVDDADGVDEVVVKASGVWAVLKRGLRGQRYGYRPGKPGARSLRHCRRSALLGAIELALAGKVR